MKDFFQQAFGLDRRRVGVSLDGNRLTVVQVLRSRDGVPVEKSFTLPFSSSEHEVAARRRLDEEGIRLEDVTATVPQKLAVVKFLRLPSTDPAELAGMASLQAGRQMPFLPEEMVVDSEVLSSEGGYSRVMMTVVRKEDVRRIVDGLRRAGFSPARLILAARATAPLFARRGKVLLVEVDEVSSTIALLEEGTPRSVRSIPAGITSFKNGRDAWTARMAREISLSLKACEAEDPSFSPSKVLLAGAQEGRDALALVLGDFLPSLSVEDAGMERQERESSTLPALGAALFPEDGRARLLPAEDRSTAARVRGRKEKALFTVLAAFFVLSGGGILWRSSAIKRERIALLDRRLKEIAPEAVELRRIDEELRKMREQWSEKNSLPGLMGRLNRLAPPRISLSSVEFERGRVLSLQGTTFNLSDAVDFVNALQRAGLFHEVELKSSNVRSFHGRDLVNFEIECHLPREEK